MELPRVERLGRLRIAPRQRSRMRECAGRGEARAAGNTGRRLHLAVALSGFADDQAESPIAVVIGKTILRSDEG